MLQRSVAAQAVCLLLARPAQEVFAQRLEKLLQFGGRGVLADRVFGLVQHMQVDQAQCEGLQAPALAQQGAIHLELRPVQQRLVGCNGLQRATKGLELFQRVVHGVKAIGAPTHQQARVAAREADLGLVLRPAPLRYQHMPFAALLRRGRRRKAQVQVARLRRERAQVAYRDGVGGAHGPGAVPCSTSKSWPGSSAGSQASGASGVALASAIQSANGKSGTARWGA